MPPVTPQGNVCEGKCSEWQQHARIVHRTVSGWRTGSGRLVIIGHFKGVFGIPAKTNTIPLMALINLFKEQCRFLSLGRVLVKVRWLFRYTVHFECERFQVQSIAASLQRNRTCYQLLLCVAFQQHNKILSGMRCLFSRPVELTLTIYKNSVMIRECTY